MGGFGKSWKREKKAKPYSKTCRNFDSRRVGDRRHRGGKSRAAKFAVRPKIPYFGTVFGNAIAVDLNSAVISSPSRLPQHGI